MNRSIFNYIFGFSKNASVANMALFFSYHFIFALVAVLLFWSLFLAPKKIYSFTLLLVSGLGALLTATLLKLIFIIDRPYVNVENVNPLVKAIGFSFPSGHAAGMAGLAVAGYFLNPKLGIALGIFAFFIGLSRIVIGVHYPSDVLVGWIVGGAIGFLAVKLL